MCLLSHQQFPITLVFKYKQECKKKTICDFRGSRLDHPGPNYQSKCVGAVCHYVHTQVDPSGLAINSDHVVHHHRYRGKCIILTQEGEL